MSDFMREVDQDYRRERTMRFLSRYSILIAAVVIASVVGAGVWRYTVDRRTAAAEADNVRFSAAEKQARDGAGAEARKSYASLAGDGVSGYPLLAGMREAEELAVGGDREGAAKRFDAIASAEGSSQAMRDAARFRGALLRVDLEDPRKFEDQYGRFALEAFTFHAGIRELLALAAMKRGDSAAAQRYFGDIVIDGSAPGPLRGRAQAFLELARSGSASASDKAALPATVTPVTTPAPVEKPPVTAATSAASTLVPSPPKPAAASPPALPSTAAPDPAPPSQPTSPAAQPH